MVKTANINEKFNSLNWCVGWHLMTRTNEKGENMKKGLYDFAEH